MHDMKITPTQLPEVLLIEPRVFGDQRGFFLETWSKQRYADAGLSVDFVQDNHSRSRKGVLRGLHYQLARPQGKLVSVTAGKVFDVAVDIRRGSPRFGRWVGFELSEDNHQQLYVPPGFAHGFCVLSDSADFVYKCTDYYSPDDEQCIRWDDADIGIEWPDGEFIVSEKDAANGRLASMTSVLPVYEDFA